LFCSLAVRCALCADLCFVENSSRNLARISCALVDEKELLASIVRWTIAFTVNTKQHLRFEWHPTELQQILTEADIELLANSEHKPLYTLEKLSNFTREALDSSECPSINSDIWMGMDTNLSNFGNALSSCERILTSE